VGVLGISLLDSISDYYSLRTRDAFVGVLFVVAWFLFAYRGYERKDDLAGDLACLFALGVALFPNSGEDWEKVIHFSSAAAFFPAKRRESQRVFGLLEPTVQRVSRKDPVGRAWGREHPCVLPTANQSLDGEVDHAARSVDVLQLQGARRRTEMHSQ
jgi:hypothetical protein